MHTFGFSDQISQQLKTVRFVKLRIESFYGEAGGLRHLSFGGTIAPQGINIKQEVEYRHLLENHLLNHMLYQ